MKLSRKKFAFIIGISFLVTIVVGLLLPESLVIPVKGATRADWNSKSFWFHPWGKSGVHKGIDIFAEEGTPVLAACPGIVLYTGSNPVGGNFVSIMGPKWRVHYYAHLKTVNTRGWTFVRQGELIGTVGATGNAAGKPPHLHYSIITQVPYVWRFKFEKYGFDRMFYLNPHEKLIHDTVNAVRRADDMTRRTSFTS
jgi:murein DD-endopeptidase MepM/ murein hydrolase activator NlpD